MDPPPKRITLLCADDIAIAKWAGVGFKVYHGQPPLLALLREGSKVKEDYVLIVDGSAGVEELPMQLSGVMLHAAGSEAYGSALLSVGGVLLPPGGQPESCVSASKMHRSIPIHAPSSPFLVQSTWLAAPQIANGARTDLAYELALSLALWRKAGVPAFAIPVDRAEGSCVRLEEQFTADDAAKLGSLFAAEQAAGEALSEDGATEAGANKGPGKVKVPKPGKVHPAVPMDHHGAIVLLVSGVEELRAARPLACALAGRHDLRVLLADAEVDSNWDKTEVCHLAITVLRPKSARDSVSLRLAATLDSIRDVDLAVYAQESVRAREWDEVLRWRGGVFGPAHGGKWRSREQQEQLGGTVVVVLKTDELSQAEWMGALDMGALKQWHTPRIDVSVVTNDRPGSLGRLLASLQHASYFGDQISLNINMEQTADRATQRLVDSLHWPDGHVTLRHRVVLGGLLPAIVESWYPSSNDSYGVLLEDDIEVSPLFYGWLKMSILQYRYSPSGRAQSQRLFGISLYQPRNLELRPPRRIPFDAHKVFASLGLASDVPYLSQIPCSWGAVYFPEVWREFHSYLALRLSETGLPISDSIVPEIMSNHWPRSWKKYFIELVYMRGYVMLYPNYRDFLSLSTNHFEVGTHVHVSPANAKKKELFWVPLMGGENGGSLVDMPEGRLPSWPTLPILDLWGSLATDDELVERGWQSVALLDTCPPFRLDVPPTYNARELLCAKKYADTGGLVDARPLAPVVVRPKTGSQDPPEEVEAKADTVPPRMVDHVDRIGGDAMAAGGAPKPAGVHAHAHEGENEGELERVPAAAPLGKEEEAEAAGEVEKEGDDEDEDEDDDDEDDDEVEPVLVVPGTAAAAEEEDEQEAEADEPAADLKKREDEPEADEERNPWADEENDEEEEGDQA